MSARRCDPAASYLSGVQHASSSRDPVRAVPCASCGYDLTGLSPTAACPECARPVAESIVAWGQWTGDGRRRLVGSVIAASGTGACLVVVFVITSTMSPTSALELLVGSLIVAGAFMSLASLWAAMPPGPWSLWRRVPAGAVSVAVTLPSAQVAINVVDQGPIIPWSGAEESVVLLLAVEAVVGALVAWRWRSALLRLAPRTAWTATSSTWLLGVSATIAVPALLAWSLDAAPGLRVLAPVALTIAAGSMALGCLGIAAAGVACILAARRSRGPAR
ncbi:MAG: hypothetical protein FGM39_06275 [Phycisphaerales bacterium]|nr:hypothetical protein [Phycisphaerales bacterium]